MTGAVDVNGAMLPFLSFLVGAPRNLPCRFAWLLILAQRGVAPDLRHAAYVFPNTQRPFERA